MQRKLSLGGLFLLFLLFCTILSCIHPDKTSSEDTISIEDTFPSTENTISNIEDITPTEVTNTWAEDTLFCTSVIDGDTFKLETGEPVRLIGIDAPELSQPGGEVSREYLTHLILNKGVTLETGYEDRDKYNRLLRFVYIEFENVLFRLMGIDAFEISKINVESLWNSKFLYKLTKSLRNYLKPKLTEESARTHKNLGIQTTEYLESILEEELKVSLKNQVLDRYGRPLYYLLSWNEETYNVRLVQSGWTIPYFIYPKARARFEVFFKDDVTEEECVKFQFRMHQYPIS